MISIVIKTELTGSASEGFASYLNAHMEREAPLYPSYKFSLTGVPAYMKVSALPRVPAPPPNPPCP